MEFNIKNRLTHAWNAKVADEDVKASHMKFAI